MRIFKAIIDFHNREDLKDNILYQGFKKFEILAITALLVAGIAYLILAASYFMPTVIKYAFAAVKINLTLSASLLALFFLVKGATWIGEKVHKKFWKACVIA